MWIMIRWLRQKPADLDLQCFKNKNINPGLAGEVESMATCPFS